MLWSERVTTGASFLAEGTRTLFFSSWMLLVAVAIGCLALSSYVLRPQLQVEFLGSVDGSKDEARVLLMWNAGRGLNILDAKRVLLKGGRAVAGEASAPLTSRSSPVLGVEFDSVRVPVSELVVRRSTDGRTRRLAFPPGSFAAGAPGPSGVFPLNDLIPVPTLPGDWLRDALLSGGIVLLGLLALVALVVVGRVASVGSIGWIFPRWLGHPLAPAGLMLALGLGAGLSLAAQTPPFQVPDEPEHFNQSWALAWGAAAGDPAGDRQVVLLSEAVLRLQEASERMQFRPAAKAAQVFSREVLDRPVGGDATPVKALTKFRLPYVGSAAALRLAALFPHTAKQIALTARVGSLLFSLALAVAALAYLGQGPGWSLAVCFLGPTAIAQLASPSYDSFLFALVIVWFAVWWRAMRAPPIGRSGWVVALVLGAVSLALAITKLPYVLLAVIGLTLVASGMSERQRLVGLSIAVCAAVAVAWMTAPWAKRVATDPWSFVEIVGSTLSYFGPFFTASGIGVLGWLDTDVGNCARWLWVLALVAAVLADAGGGRLNASTRCLAILVLVITLFALMLAMFIRWTPPGSFLIEGLQGRYFLPLLPLLVIAVLPRKKLVEQPSAFRLISAAALVACWFSAWPQIQERFYG